MKEKGLLLVPVHLDALALSEQTTVLDPAGHFDQLPYFNGTQEINRQRANISEEIVSVPFQDLNFHLSPGVHLFWSLPRALVKGKSNDAGQITFPQVPNRWLVTRTNKDASIKQWIVESDYLHCAGVDHRSASINIPYPRYFIGLHNPEAFIELIKIVYKQETTLSQFIHAALPASGKFEEIVKEFNLERALLFIKYFNQLLKNPNFYSESRFNQVVLSESLKILLEQHKRKSLQNDKLIKFNRLLLDAAYPGIADKLGYQPFRHLGRQLPYNANYQPIDPQAEYLDALTAVGYGEATFAALYSNCHSVFGFYDNELIGNAVAGVSYDVIGWYADPTKDAYRQTAISLNDIEQIKKNFQWEFSAITSAIPQQMVCYAQLDFADKLQASAFNTDPIKVSVGNTITEALSTYLNAELNPPTSNSDRFLIEKQLEALHLTDQLEAEILDTGAKFREMRHEKEFSALMTGTLWITKAKETPIENVVPWADLVPAKLLNERLAQLNQLQQMYEDNQAEIVSLQQQLFADWYKYMLVTYANPNRPLISASPDELQYFIELRLIKPLQELIAETGTLIIKKQQEPNKPQLFKVSWSGAENCLAAQIAKLVDKWQREWADFILVPIANARYWQPADPVVLLSGEATAASQRNGHQAISKPNDYLTCLAVENDAIEFPLSTKSLSFIRKKANEQFANKASKDEDIPGYSYYTDLTSAWHPLLLQWEAELFPSKWQSNFDQTNGNYTEDFILENYELQEDDPDLRPKQYEVSKSYNLYSGVSILTPHTAFDLEKKLFSYLQKNALSTPQQRQKYLADNKNDFTNPIITAIHAYEHIQQESFLAQALDGFNLGLLMRKKTLQLAIDDPLNFPDYAAFTERVAILLENAVLQAPLLYQYFNPLRTGMWQLQRLRLVDSFGRVLDINPKPTIACEKMATTLPDNKLLLPPRIMQPAQLNLRWLSAKDTDNTMYESPKAEVICGWLLPNHLEQSIMVYDATGLSLGSLDREAQWRAAPGRNDFIDIDHIENPHLRKVVNYLATADQKFYSAFMQALDKNTQSCQPAQATQQFSLAWLIGRPLAVVRASVELQIQGSPILDQSLYALEQDLQRKSRRNSLFTWVKFPVCIGDVNQLNDGVIGYWPEQDDSLEDAFYAHHSVLMRDEANQPPKPQHLDLAINDAPLQLTLLMDPHGELNAITGILPTKTITIPTAQYVSALQAINVTFLTAPVLSQQEQINLLLPTVAGWQWSWLTKRGAFWQEIPQAGILTKTYLANHFADYELIWTELKDQGWLQEIDANTAQIVITEEQSNNQFSPTVAKLLSEIKQLLAQLPHIGNLAQQPVFSGKQAIHEGWLKLSHKAFK